MTSNSAGTYLRFLRRRSGLSQRDLARILGSVSVSQISRHERSKTLPTMLIAFGYQVVFQKPVSEIFPGLFHAVETGVEERLEEFERELNMRAAKEGSAAPVKLHVEPIHEREKDESM
jgi:transcriptional regulator with XRE-family HTH domain